MTKFEEKLLTKLIIVSSESNAMIGSIIRAIDGEDCEHKGDYFESEVINCISEYLQTFISDKDRVDYIIETEIIPEVRVGNYINAISIINRIEG